MHSLKSVVFLSDPDEPLHEKPLLAMHNCLFLLFLVGLNFCNELMEESFKIQPCFPCANTEVSLWLIRKLLAKKGC